MDVKILIISSVIAYFLGSIPWGYILVKLFVRKDVREIGSGNIGATNVTRTGSKFLGVLTLILDGLKGYVSIYIADYLSKGDYRIVLLAGILAIFGHCYTIFLKFKGGKGVATSAGVFLALKPICVLYSLIFFLVVVAIKRYVSLGSILGALSFPLFLYLTGERDPYLIVGSLLVALIIVYRHKENIDRLLKGQENKIKL